MPSKEASLLRKYFDKLVSAIANPIPLADALYSREIIDKSTQLDAAIQSKNVRDRSSKLLSDIERFLESEPDKFETVLSIFREHLTTETLLNEIEGKYYEIKGKPHPQLTFPLTLLQQYFPVACPSGLQCMSL